MATRARRWIWRAAVLLGVVGAAGGGLALMAQTAAFREWLRGEVVARVNAELNGRLAIGALDGNVFGRLIARDVRVLQEGRRVLAVRRLTATYDLLTLVRGGGLRITSLVVDGFALALVADERGWNVERLVPSSEPHAPSSLIVDVRALRATDGAVRVVRPGRGWRLRDVTFGGAARLAPDETRVAVDALAFREARSGVRFEEVTGRIAAAHDGAWTIDDARVRTSASSFALSAHVGDVVRGELDVGRLAAAEVRALVRADVPRSDWRGRATAAGPRGAVVLAAEVTAEVPGDAAARTAGQARLTGTLDLAATPSRGTVRAEIAHLDAAALAGDRVPVTDVTGVVTLGAAEGAYDVGLELGPSRIAGVALVSATGSAHVTDDGVRFAAAVASAAGDVRASGDVAPRTERFAVEVAARDLDLGALFARPALAGRLTASAHAAGVGFAAATTRLDATLALAPSRVGAVAVTRGEAAMRADAGRLVIERLDVATNVGSMTAAGDAVLGRGVDVATSGVHAELRVTDLAPLAALVGRPDATGAATATVTLRGSPAAFDADVVLAGRGLGGSGWRAATVDATLTGRALGAPAGTTELRATIGDGALGARRLAEVALDASGRGTGAALAGAVALRAREPDGASHELRAEVTRRGEVTRATIATLRFVERGTAWTAVGTPVLELRGETLAIQDLTVRSPRGSVRVAGRLAARDSDLALGVDGLDLAALAGLVPEGVRGRLIARARLGGSFTAPRVDADARVDAPELGGTRYDELALQLAIGAGRGELHGRLARSSQTLTVDATAPLTLVVSPFRFALGDPDARVRADGIDVAFVEALWPGLVAKVGGTMAADVRISGSIDAPEAHGTIALTGGRAYVVPLGVTYDAIDVALGLEGRVASIERMTIASGKGRIVGGGTARLGAEGATMDARFEARRFPLFANAYGHGAASGWLWISGTSAAPVLEGSLETEGLVLQVPEALPGTIRPADPTIVVIGPGAPPPPVVPDAPAPAPPVPGLYERAAVTVQLSVPRDTWLRRSDANVELEGWITAWKKPGEELHVAGDIRGVRGWYAFQGKKFTLEEGSVRFSGQGFDPVLDIAATHRAGEYLVRLKVGGTVTKPTLALESEPALEQADVLAVLLFGAPANQLTRSQSTGLREQALGIAGGYVASELRQSVASALGVDDLQFDTGTTGLQDARVSVGKYVADDIFVSLAHRFGTSVEEVRIEYIFRPGWSLETSTDTLGRSGVDLLWKRRY